MLDMINDPHTLVFMVPFAVIFLLETWPFRSGFFYHIQLCINDMDRLFMKIANYIRYFISPNEISSNLSHI